MITINLHVTNLRPAFPPTLDIEYRVDGGQPISLQSTAPGIYPVSLPAPGPYNFEVRTVNAYGVSPWSTVKASDDLSIVNDLLFSQNQPGGAWLPTLSSAMISAETFGTGVQDILDLSPRNNPFSQATPASRGAWFREPKTGRRNLLIESNGFNLSPWAFVASGGGVNPVVTPNAGVDPIGGNQAFRIDFNRGGDTISDRSEINQTLSAALTGQNVLSVWVKAATSGDVGKDIAIRHVGSAAYGSVTLTADWVRVSRVETAAGSANNVALASRGTFNTSATVSALVYQTQLEAGSTVTPNQNVTTAFDVTESGQRDCFGVRADGTDDFYTTASTDFTGTDKVTVFAAVRKLSDANIATIAKLAASNTAAGSFQMFGPSGASATYGFESVGGNTTPRFANASSFVAPTYNIVTGLADISGNQSLIRVDAVQRAVITSDQGGGTFANDTLRLFTNTGSVRFFNGNLYALIVAGGSYPLSTIQRVERILSRITPTVNL